MVSSRNTATFNWNTNPLDGLIAQAVHGGKAENFLWDDLALVHRGETSFVNEPYVTGGTPFFSSKQGIMFNDLLGNTLGIKREKYNSVAMTAFDKTKDTYLNYNNPKGIINMKNYSYLYAVIIASAAACRPRSVPPRR